MQKHGIVYAKRHPLFDVLLKPGQHTQESKVKSALYTALMLAAFSGCTKSADQSEVHAGDHELQANDDCFTSLIAGNKAPNGKLETISFAHGICQGSSRALDKISEQKTIFLVANGETREAEVFIENTNVVAKIKEEKIVIGALSKNPDDAEIAINLGTKIELLVSNDSGVPTVWRKGTESKGQESIRITLR